MAWSLYHHVTSHATYTVDRLDSFDENAKNVHFKASIDTFQLLANGYTTQQDIDSLMRKFVNEVAIFSKTYVRSKGRSKTGKQLKRKVHVDFAKDCLLAYHSSSSEDHRTENYRVEPHIHIVCKPSLRLGKGYQFIRDAISHVSRQHGLVFHLEEETGQKKVHDKTSSDMTWMSRKFSDTEFKKRIENGWYSKLFDRFRKVYFETGNIQFYLKGIRDIEYRCKKLGIDHGLNFNLFLTAEQKQTLNVLFSANKHAVIELINDRQNKLARAYYEHTMGHSNIIIDELEKRSGVRFPIVKIDPSELTVTISRKSRLQQAGTLEKFKKTLTYAYTKDLETVLRYAASEKDAQALFLRLGYTEFRFKAQNVAKKRERTGFTFKRNGRITTVYFNTLKTSAAQIRAVLVENAKRSIEHPAELHSHLRGYMPPSRKSYSTKLFEEIYNFSEILDLKGFYVKEHDGKVEVKRRGTLIVDDVTDNHSITVHRQRHEDIETNVRIIADMLEARGITRCNVTGSEEFKLAMKTELQKRKDNRNAKTIQLTVDAFDIYEECMLKSSAVAGEDSDRLIEAIEGAVEKQHVGALDTRTKEII